MLNNLNSELKESDIQLLHLNTNWSIEWVKDSLDKSLWWFLSFFFARTPEAIYSTSNVSSMIDEYLKIWWDVIWFTEVFWKQQRDFVTNSLESRWYKVFVTDAFEMWSQDFEWEHLYNILAIKDNSINSENVKRTYSKNKRPISATICSFTHFLNWLLENGTIWTWKEDIKMAINIYSRLVSWILDWAITEVPCSDLIITHHHVHPDNWNLKKVYAPHINTDFPNVIFWDFNQWEQKFDKLLREDPFNWIYTWFMEEWDITYPNSKWFEKINPLQSTLDNVAWNQFIENKWTRSIDSNSDHRWVISRIRVK